MKLTRSSPALIATFDAVFPADARAERKLMFGYPSGFVNGNMFAGLFAEDLFVRVSDDEQKSLLSLPGAHVLEPMPGRPMKGYACVPAALHDDRAALKKWMAKAIAHTASLPPKVKKAATAAKKAVASKRRASPAKKR